MKKKVSEALKILFFVALGVLLTWLSLRNIPSKTFFENLQAVNPLWFALALLISLLSHVIRALRWNMLLRPSGHKVKPLNAIMAVFAGYFINLALPRTGEVARCGLVSKYDKVPVSVGVGTVVAERVIDMIFLLIFFILSFFFGYEKLQAYIREKIIYPLTERVSLPLVVGGFFLLGLVAVLAFLYFRKKKKASSEKRGILDGFMDGLRSVMEVRNPLGFVLSSLSIWACYYFMLYLGFLSHPATAGLGLDACLAVFVFGTIGMIVTPGGIGAYPALVGQTLVLYGVDEAAGISFGWIIWGAQTILFIMIGPLSLIGFPVLNRTNNTVNDEGTATT